MTDWVKMPIRVGVYIKKMGKFQPFFSRINSALSQGYLTRRAGRLDNVLHANAGKDLTAKGLSIGVI